jgi:hypothetical protein
MKIGPVLAQFNVSILGYLYVTCMHMDAASDHGDTKAVPTGLGNSEHDRKQ